MEEKQNKYKEFPKTKLENKIKLLIRDYKEKNNSDVVKKCKEIILFLTERYIKKHYQGNYWDFKKRSSEEKLGFLLDKGAISERLFDNCILAKELRNPTEHHFTEPREEFVDGALKTTQDLYFCLQLELNLPEIPEWIKLSEELEVEWPLAIRIELTEKIPNFRETIINEILPAIKKEILVSPGKDVIIIEFPKDIKDTIDTGGIRMNETIKYNETLIEAIKKLPFVRSVERTVIHSIDFSSDKDFK